ncbi:MAG: putative membrane protein [Verrucomicrobiales bacterium]|jgi:uncharacterized membrane protein
MESRVISLEEASRNRRHQYLVRGQWCGVVSFAMILILAGFMVYMGDAKSAAWMVGATLAAVSGVFVAGRVLESKEEENK